MTCILKVSNNKINVIIRFVALIINIIIIYQWGLIVIIIISFTDYAVRPGPVQNYLWNNE
jgi:hypothetical protein